MLNFTVGPVQSSETIRKIGYKQVPYFRTPEFSEIMFENERLMKKFAGANKNDRVIFITGSGTASMEAVVMNVFTSYDKVLIVNGGSFGQRFVDLCKIHNISFDEIKLNTGKALKADDLEQYEGKGYTGFLVNIDETSTGVLYDLDLISDFCKRNGIFLVVDAISSFLADEINMTSSNIKVMITGSQKALACPPGISVIVLSEDAVEKINSNQVRSLYFDLKSALKNGERGQTPFTPAVSILLQIHERLKQIELAGGLYTELNRISALASDFRDRIKDLPLDICSESLSNAVTPLSTRNCSAYDIFTILKDEYQIWVCPNGGELKDKVFRVGHLGELSIEDNKILVGALCDLCKKKRLK